MSFASSPLAVVETHFSQLAPSYLTLHGADCHPWLCDRTYSLYELRDLLLHRETPYDVRDAVWRHTIRAARHSQDWMVGVLGLCMPALRAAARRACRGLTFGGVDAVESAILCETIHRARTINLAYARLAWYLTRPALRAALSVRKHELRAPVPAGTPGDRQDPAPAVAGSPDQLLAAAVYSGVLTRDQERLIAHTRLENVPLAEAAEQAGCPTRRSPSAASAPKHAWHTPCERAKYCSPTPRTIPLPKPRTSSERCVPSHRRLAAGADVEVVSGELGHATTHFTQDTYQTVFPEVAESAAETTAAMLKPAR